MTLNERNQTMFRAKLITPMTIDFLTSINEGVRPDNECMYQAYFVYSDDPDVPNEIMDKEVFWLTHRFVESDDLNDNSVERVN